MTFKNRAPRRNCSDMDALILEIFGLLNSFGAYQRCRELRLRR